MSKTYLVKNVDGTLEIVPKHVFDLRNKIMQIIPCNNGGEDRIEPRYTDEFFVSTGKTLESSGTMNASTIAQLLIPLNANSKSI